MAPTSGNGNGTVTVSFAANTSTTEDKVAHITVSTTAEVEVKSYTVTVTQQKVASSGEEKTLTITVSDYVSSFATETDATYGAGYSATIQGVKVGYYKYQSTSNAVAPSSDHFRVYKSSVLYLSVSGGKIKNVVMTCTGSSNCKNMTALVGGGTATSDGNVTLTWTPSAPASPIVAQASEAQNRIKELKITYITD